MIVVGVTGGIGAGKSAVTDAMAAKGALVVDADVIAREIVEPGSEALDEIIHVFGDSVVNELGDLDRQRVADLIFANENLRLTLNSITHPRINQVMKASIEESRLRSGVCLVAIPLLVAEHRKRLGLNAVVVVDCPTEVAVDRLVRQRNFDESDARARIASQMSRDDRLLLADYVVDNKGDVNDLNHQIDRLWHTLLERPEAQGHG